MEAIELAKKIVAALESKKALELKLLKVEDLTVLTDYFVIASGTSNTHVGALAEEVDYRLSKEGIEPSRVEGAKSRSWILMDYGSVVAHIFYPETREYYALERLWADAVPVELEPESV
ncbi:ribosome silencing factor [Ruminococcaceae bacterium OttesenSCG-928-I18]|nr:ribosome silencing factor [Ruminococcaceae bacterium OttesenSCG-928-I18]